MERIIDYTITEEFTNRKISDFLKNKGYSTQNLTELKHMKESILLNGKWEYMNTRLKEGDLLRVHIVEEECSQKIPPVDLPFPIIYEDEDLLVIDKPANMPIHPSMKNYENTLGNAAAFYFAKQGKPFIYRCINRLDKDTTGLTIIAKHMVSCSILYDQMRDRIIKRKYFAIVEGSLSPKKGTIDFPLGRDMDSAIARKVDYEHGEAAITHYEVLGENGGLSYVAFELETGRTHQIRVHMKAIGHPLIGDFLYNPQNEQMKRQALHAGELTFIHPITGEEMHFKTPTPKDMLCILQAYRLT